MEQIKIYHAFNGFLYAPIFLAEKLGLFPKNTKLIYVQGDDKAIQALCSHSHTGERNWFAICDPFSVDLNMAVEHTDDEICVIGSLINVLPIWVFNPDQSIDVVRHENDLARYNN